MRSALLNSLLWKEDTINIPEPSCINADRNKGGYCSTNSAGTDAGARAGAASKSETEPNINNINVDSFLQ